MIRRFLGLHGVALEVECPRQVEAWFDFDFSAMRRDSPGAPCQRIRWYLRECPLPAGCRERIRGAHFVVMGQAEERWIVYPGQGSALYRPGQGVDWYCPDLEFGYERLTMFLHCLLGLELEMGGLQRVHGLALALPDLNQAALVLLPPGGGKSTLAHSLLRRGSPLRLLSEDTPVVDRRGRLWSYPYRLGLRQSTSLPSQRRGSKWVIEFPGQGEVGPIDCGQVLVGAWTSDRRPECRPLGLFPRALPLLREAWLAHGVPQLLEVQLPLSAGQGMHLSYRMLARCWRCLSLAGRCRWYRLWLGPDADQNADFLTSWLVDRS